MEALALKFETNYPKIIYIYLNFLMVNVIKNNKYINIYKCHTKQSFKSERWIKIETQWKEKIKWMK